MRTAKHLAAIVVPLLSVASAGCLALREPTFEITFRRDGQSPSDESQSDGRSGLVVRSAYLAELENHIEIHCAKFEFQRREESIPRSGRTRDSWMIRITAPRLEETARPRLCRIQLLLARESRLGSVDERGRETLEPYEGEAYLQFEFERSHVATHLTGLRLESVRDPGDVLFVSGRVSGYRLGDGVPTDRWAASFEKIWEVALDPPKDSSGEAGGKSEP